MVQMKFRSKVICSFLFLTQTAQATLPSLTLHWVGDQSKPCQNLIKDFLAELRSMAMERVIELEVAAKPPTTLPSLKITDVKKNLLRMECIQAPQEAAPRIVRVRSSASYQEALDLHYLEKAKGFDATDWIPFQQKYLRPESDFASAPQTDGEMTSPLLDKPNPAMENQPATTTIQETPLYKRWWFWAAIGGLGLGAYALTRGFNAQNSANIEIH